MVCETLGRLDMTQYGAEDRRGNLYRPVPPEVLLDRYEQEQLSLISNLRENLHRLYSASAEERLWSINGHNAVLVYAQQMIETARGEILLVLSDPHLEALTGKLQQACASGVAVKTLLTGLGHLDCGQVARHPPLETSCSS
jgi:Cd2+/Zn2+-exporting ATPase